MDFVYSDYASWKLDNEEIIKDLLNTSIVIRFKHIYDVVEKIYQMALNHEEVSKEEIEIFQFGFDYLFDQFIVLSMLLKEYDNDVEELLKQAKTVNFLLYILDFTRELDDDKKEYAEKFAELEEKAYDYLKQKKEIPDELFSLLNDLVFSAFHDGDYNGVVEIFLDIADELGVDYVEDNIYTIEK